MPVTVEIDGLGKVELDDSFKSKSASEQEQIISEIVSQARPQSHSGGGASRDRNSPETYKVLERIVKQLYPHAQITSDKRTPEHNAAVGGVPDSYHVSGQGLDIDGLSADERSDLKQQMEGMGIKFDEFMFHKVAKGGGLHLHMASTHVPAELFGDPAAEPEAPEDLPAPQASSAPEQPQGQPGGVPPQAPEVDDGSFFGMPKDWNEFGKGLEIGAGDVVEGIGDTLGIAANPINTYLAKALGYDPDYRADLGGSMRDALGLDRSTSTEGRISSDVISGATGGLTFSGLAGAGGKATGTLVQQGLAKMGATPVADAVAGGTSALAADAAEASDVGGAGQMAAALAGAAVGAGGAGLAKAALPEARAARFAANQSKNNPSAAYDAEIVQDLTKAHETLNRSKTDPKARAPLDVKVINDVQDSYTDQTVELIKQLKLPKMEELRFRNALSRKHSLPQEEIDALRGSVAGDAVADAIIKTQRLKRLTPEIARDPSILARAGNALGTGLDFVPGVPGIVGRGVRWASKATSGDAEAARVHAAKALLDKKRGYAKLQEMVGPSGQRESRQALWDEAATMQAEKEAGNTVDPVKLAKAKDRAFAAKEKMAGTTPPKPSTVQTQANTAWNQRDKAMAAAEKLKAQQEESLWAAKPTEPDAPVPVDPKVLKAEIGDWDTQLKDIASRKAAVAKANAPAPVKAEKPPKPKPLGDQLIDSAIDQGLPGTSQTRQAFKDRLGIQDDTQFDQVLDDFVATNPAAKPEVDRIRLSYPTKDRTFGAKATPHLKSAMDKLGIKPVEKAATVKAPVPVDEAAQARLAGETAPKPALPAELAAKRQQLEAKLEEVDPVVVTLTDGQGTRASEDPSYTFKPEERAQVDAIRKELSDLQVQETEYYKQIRRPQQYAESKERRVGMASDAIYDLSTKVRPEVMDRLKRLPEHARDNIKIGDDARKFFDDDVYNEMMAAGATPQEIDAARTTFYDIATVKPYQTQDEFNAGALTRGRGRPRKQN